MSRHMRPALLLAFAMGLSACAARGPVASPHVCPQTQGPSARLLSKTDYAAKVCNEFLDGSENCRQSETSASTDGPR